MPPRPTVPFEVHPSLRLRANVDVPGAWRVALSAAGSLAVVVRADDLASELSFRATAGGPVTSAVPMHERGWFDSVAWSRDGARWGAVSEWWDGATRRSRVLFGARDLTAPVAAIDGPTGGGITINHQSRAAPLAALTADGARVAYRVRQGERYALTVADIARREAVTHELPEGAPDLFAHAWGGDGALYTAAMHLGAQGGVARWDADCAAPTRRWEWASGCALAPARDGVWAVGSGGVVWRIGEAGGGAFVTAKDERLARARALRARATHRWDVAYLDQLVDHIAHDRRNFTWETNTPRARWGPLPEPMEGARGFDTEFLWECAFVEPVGDDAVVVSDGLSVALLRDRGASLARRTLLEDTERCSPRTRRIVGLTSAGSTVGVLWQKSAARTILSLFDLDVTAL